MKLPIGFRFRPTDEELVVHYLRRKARSLPLPASVIPEFDVFHSDPWSLPGDSCEKRYYFWKKKGGSNCKISAASRGYWKCNNGRGKGKHIAASVSGSGTERCSDHRHGTAPAVVLGTRKTWTYYYYQGKHNAAASASKTRWVLHEFHLLPDQNHGNPNCRMQDEERDTWVVCRVFQRRMKPSECNKNSANNNTIEYSGFGRDAGPSYIENGCRHQSGCYATPPLAAASPCSSDITTEMEEAALPAPGDDATNYDDQDDTSASPTPPPCSY